MASGQVLCKPILEHTLKAAADLSTKQFYFVKHSAASTINVCSANTDIALGILQDKPDTAGDSAKIMLMGISLLKLGGTVTRNAHIMPHTDGTGVAATNNKPSAAIALESGESGDEIPVLLTCGAYVSSS